MTYTFSVTRIKRSRGDSFMSYSEYISGKNGHKGVRAHEVMLPPWVPERFRDPEYLWPSLDKAEKLKTAFLGWSFMIDLDFNLPPQQRKRMLKQYIEENFTGRGIICEYAIHESIRNPGKVHVHMLCPAREVDENGNWKNKYATKEVTDPSGDTKKVSYAVNDWDKRTTFDSWIKNWENNWNPTLVLSGQEPLKNYTAKELGYIRIKKLKETNIDRGKRMRGERCELDEINEWITEINKYNRDAYLDRYMANSRKEELREQMKLIAFLSRYVTPSLKDYLRGAVNYSIWNCPEEAGELIEAGRAMEDFLSVNKFRNPVELDTIRARLKELRRGYTLLGFEESDAERQIRQTNMDIGAGNYYNTECLPVYRKYMSLPPEYRASFRSRYGSLLSECDKYRARFGSLLRPDGQFPSSEMNNRVKQLIEKIGSLQRQRAEIAEATHFVQDTINFISEGMSRWQEICEKGLNRKIIWEEILYPETESRQPDENQPDENASRAARNKSRDDDMCL